MTRQELTRLAAMIKDVRVSARSLPSEPEKSTAMAVIDDIEQRAVDGFVLPQDVAWFRQQSGRDA